MSAIICPKCDGEGWQNARNVHCERITVKCSLCEGDGSLEPGDESATFKVTEQIHDRSRYIHHNAEELAFWESPEGLARFGPERAAMHATGYRESIETDTKTRMRWIQVLAKLVEL